MACGGVQRIEPLASAVRLRILNAETVRFSGLFESIGTRKPENAAFALHVRYTANLGILRTGIAGTAFPGEPCDNDR